MTEKKCGSIVIPINGGKGADQMKDAIIARRTYYAISKEPVTTD